MRCKLALLSYLILVINFVNAQDYWQQKVDYDIDVRLNSNKDLLIGQIEMNYQNNAPVHLDTIYFHLWPNAYSKYNTALAKQLLEEGNYRLDALPQQLLGGIGKFDFKVNGKSATFIADEKHADIGYLVLNEVLLPGKSVTIETPFNVKVPASVSRMGTEDNFYSISQWYPKPAVYDEDGWHAMPYLDQGEFYAEFGTYKVDIAVPKGYKVAATGVETNVSESDSLTHFTFEQDKVHDFAWFASEEYKIDKKVITLPNEQDVTIQTFSITDNDAWNNCNQFIEQSIQFLSKTIGNYPYATYTVVEAPLRSGGGMEYPTITVLQNDEDVSRFESVVAHEIAHSYWQGILASNERIAPWIDEGFTTYYEKRYNYEHATNQFDPAKPFAKRKIANFFGLSDLDYAKGEKFLLQNAERKNAHQAANLASDEYSSYNYFLQHYVKVPHQIIYLEKYLGRAEFDKCIQSFYADNQFQHINADQLRIHFESCSGKDLDFFFEDWLKTEGVVNAKVGKVYASDGMLTAEIIQKGEVLVPVPVKVIHESGEQTIWVDAAKINTIDVQEEGLKQIIIDPENLTMDYDRSNNYYKTKGFGKLEKIRLQPFAGMEKEDRAQLLFSPMLAGNTNDGFQLGMTFYNSLFPKKNLEWNVTPLYAFKSKQLNGIFNINYDQNIRRDRKATIHYNLHFKTFSYSTSSSGGRYVGLIPSVSATLPHKEFKKRLEHKVGLKAYVNWRELNLQSAPDVPAVKSFENLWVMEANYEMEKRDVQTPVALKSNFQFNDEHARVSTELTYKVRYGRINSYFKHRTWITAMVAKQGDFAGSDRQAFGTYQTNLAGRNGTRDYLFDHYYLGRNSNNFLGRQLFMDEGQFKFVGGSNVLASNILAVSSNFTIDFPSRFVPIKLYADVGLIYRNQSVGGGIEQKLDGVAQFGAMLSFYNEAFEIYFPIVSSGLIKDYYDLNAPKFGQRISFSINLAQLNPKKIVEELRF